MGLDALCKGERLGVLKPVTLEFDSRFAVTYTISVFIYNLVDTKRQYSYPIPVGTFPTMMLANSSHVCLARKAESTINGRRTSKSNN